MASESSRQLAAQAWYKPKTIKMKMIPELAEAFAEILDTIWSQPWLGNATTGELIEELKARSNLDYKTAG